MKKSSDILINKMVNALEKASFASGKITDPHAWWPINAVLYGPLYSNNFYSDFFRDYKKAKEKHSLKEISEAYFYPSAIWLLLVGAPIAMKAIGFSKRKRVTLTLEFLKMIQMQMVGNIFCEDGRNIIWSKDRARKFVSETDWVDVVRSYSLKNQYQKLHADLLSLNEAIFRNANNMAREIHGPYRVKYKGKKSQLLIREYYNLKDTKLELKLRNFPYESVETYSIYDTKIKFDFPVLNDYIHNLPLAAHTFAVAGKVKEKGIKRSLNQKKVVETVCAALEKKNYQISRAVERMGRGLQVIEMVRRRYYWSKKLKVLLGKNWEPSKILMDRVSRELKSFPDPKGINLTRKQYRRLIDPRID